MGIVKFILGHDELKVKLTHPLLLALADAVIIEGCEFCGVHLQKL